MGCFCWAVGWDVNLAGLSGCVFWWAVRWGVDFAGLSDGIVVLAGLSGCVCAGEGGAFIAGVFAYIYAGLGF